MNTMLPQVGLLIMFSYTLFNLYNILLLRISLPFVTFWLLSAGIVYFIVRITRFFRNKQGVSQSELAGLILVVLSFFAIVLQYLNLREYVGQDGIVSLGNMRTEWALSMLWLFAGGAVATFNVKSSTPYALLVLAVTALAFSNGLDDQLMVSYRAVLEIGVVEQINHLYMEKHVVFLLILAYCLSPKTKWLVAIIGLFLLFSMGGRTSLAVFIVCLIGMNIGKRNIKNMLFLGIVGLLLIFSLRYAIEYRIIDINSPSIERMLLIGGVSADNSFQARVQLIEINLQYLDDQFLYGDPTLFPKVFGTNGAYIHNILSAWQFYGFFVFSCIVLILISSFRRMIILKAAYPTPKIIFGSFFLMYVTISMIISKAANWDLLWFTLGFWTLLPAMKRPAKNMNRRSRAKREPSRQGPSRGNNRNPAR